MAKAHLALLVQDQDAAAQGTDVFPRELKDAFQQVAQVEIRRQLSADPVEQLERGSSALGHGGLDTQNGTLSPGQMRVF